MQCPRFQCLQLAAGILVLVLVLVLVVVLVVVLLSFPLRRATKKKGVCMLAHLT